MANNPSVEAFKVRLARLPAAAKRAARDAVYKQAEATADLMRRAAPVKTGKLRDSVRVEDGAHELQAVIRAGGSATTVTARAGQGKYDYSLGVEFGTSQGPAEPFFWPSYRLRKRQARSAITRAVSKAVKAEFDR